MDIQGLTSSVRNSNLIHSSSSPSDMGISKRICILVFNDDYICQNLVSEVLQHCTYEVLHIGRTMDALSAIRGRKNSLSLVLTNINRLKTKGAEIIQVIEKELNLSVCLILPGNMEFDSRGQECNVSSYVVNFSDINDMKELWQSALEKEKARKAASSLEENAENYSPVGVETSIENEPSVDGETGNDRKTKELREKSEENEASGGETKKKPRLSWNPEMHQRFVQAINKLGYDKAVPKKIVEFMNEPGLTREHVASHLQKYRMNLRKGQECSTDFVYGRKLTNDVTKPFYGSCPSGLNFNPSHTYSFPFERSSSVFSTPLLGQSYLLNPNMSTLPQSHMFPANNQGALNHIFTPQSSFDTMLQPRRMNQNGVMEFQSSFVPTTPMNSNFREKNNMQNGHSSGSLSINQPSSTCNSSFRFLGFRVVNDELQFGEKSSISCGEIHRESSSFTADWTSGNADSVSSPIYQQQPLTSTDQSVNYSEMSGSFIPEQQASFPPFFTPYNENSVQGFSTQGINSTSPEQQPSVQQPANSENYSEMFVMDDQTISLPLQGNSDNFSSKQQESSSLSVPPAVIEINSYGGEEDISALLDATDDTANPEGLWDNEDFNDILFSITN